MRKDDCFLLGYVIKPHGLKGEVSVLLDVDFPEDYTEMESVFLEIDQKLVPFFISAISIHRDKAVVKFEDVHTPEAAMNLKGKELYLPASALEPIEDDQQFYFHEIIGFQVRDEKFGDIGVITHVYDSGKQDLLAIDYQGTEILVPLIDEIVLRVDRDNKQMIVALPEGLMDIYLNP
jgi:16S rRNA processing protein RimM